MCHDYDQLYLKRFAEQLRRRQERDEETKKQPAAVPPKPVETSTPAERKDPVPA